ncbi:MAG: ELM1/GtrOC1 family putative glycosyltransferase, partial [Pseudomonadota bacterium]
MTSRRFPGIPRPRIDRAGAPTQVTSAALEEARDRWPDILAGAGKPRVVLLVGGTTAHHRLPPPAARQLAIAVQKFTDKNGGSLTCVTSRRTGAAAETAIAQAVPRAEIHRWRADRPA